LFGGHVQQNVAATADSESLAGADPHVIQQREYVRRGFFMAEWFR
jgi:hypothetical protein